MDRDKQREEWIRMKDIQTNSKKVIFKKMKSIQTVNGVSMALPIQGYCQC